MDDGVRLFIRCVLVLVMLLLAKDEPLVITPVEQALHWVRERIA
ncbi:hypothetical protein [Sphingomonas profundi]|nr:hypothetical protein [Sphingomonas profundi]